MEKDNSKSVLYPQQIHTYVLRAGRMTEAQKRDYVIHSARWCLPFQERILNLTDIFENTAPVTIEVG
ncbi:MAG TPA: tRNA (guanosine(46)-N7)-methyltransferase TrmB, partial [Treponemataceae bacterium]|nr:tRNA (guanosine(46)-N7)-methyltransferase TrmB [Treponemataceae bacterium]